MRPLMIAAPLIALAMPASAEVWLMRHGNCGEWQARWNVAQEQTGVWVGEIEHVHVGGPCARPTGEYFNSQVRAVIAGENLFAVRDSGGSRDGGERSLCTHVGRIRGDRARGFFLCEGSAQRSFFAIRFRARTPQQAPRDVRPDDELLDNEQGGDRGRRFQDRGLDDWFPR